MTDTGSYFMYFVHNLLRTGQVQIEKDCDFSRNLQGVEVLHSITKVFPFITLVITPHMNAFSNIQRRSNLHPSEPAIDVSSIL